MTFPSQFQRIQARVRMRLSGAWVDLTDRPTAGSRAKLLDNQTITINRGRADEASMTEASTTTFVLDNPDGALTPGNAASLWYPELDTPVECELAFYLGSPYLQLSGNSGSRAGTADHSSLDITTDWTIIEEFFPPFFVPPAGVNYELSGKFNTSGNQRSILSWIDSAAILRLRWSTDGTAGGELDALASEELLVPVDGPLTLARWLDVNNGAGGRTTHFYVCRGTLDDFLDDPAAFEFGTADTDPGTTSVHSGSAPFDVGDVTGSGFTPYPGQVSRVQVRAGDPFTGAIRADLKIRDMTPGGTTYVDSAGRTWTVQGDAQVTNARTRLVGQVDDITPSWPYGDLSTATQPGEARVAVTVSGIIRRLSQGQKALQSALFRTITSETNADAVHAYWPGEDARDSEFAYSPTPGVQPGVIRMTYANDDTLDSSQPLPSTTTTYGWAFPVPGTVPTTGWQVTWLVRIPEAPTSPAILNYVDADGTIKRWSVRIDNTLVYIDATNDAHGSELATSFSSDARMFDTWMIITLSIAQDGADVDWDIDLTPIPGGVTFGTSGTITTDTCGRPTRIHTPTFSTAPPSGISVGHFIVTTDRSTGWLAPADTAYVGEPATQRIYRLCQEQDISIAVTGEIGTDWDAVAATGVQRMGPQRPITFLELLEECAAVDLGILSEQRYGLGFHYRAGVTLQNQVASLVLDAANNEIANPLVPTRDDRHRANDVTVSRVNGSSARVTTDPPPASGEIYTGGATLNLPSDLDLADQAGWRLLLGTWPGMRYRSLPTELSIAPDIVDDYLDLPLGDRVQVTNLPPQHPTDPVDVLVQGGTETITPTLWTSQLCTSPAPPWDVGIRDDTTRGRRDTSGSELNAQFIAGTNTSMSVLITKGPFWTTAAGHMPFEILVSGVRLQVTAVGAPSGQVQTFTITQTPVNGVTKTIPAGTAVRLWRPAIRAL